MWDKTRPARLDEYGNQSYKPKRDVNGIIVCRSKEDRETCVFADNVRILRQREYDNAELYFISQTTPIETFFVKFYFVQRCFWELYSILTDH